IDNAAASSMTSEHSQGAEKDMDENSVEQNTDQNMEPVEEASASANKASIEPIVIVEAEPLIPKQIVPPFEGGGGRQWFEELWELQAEYQRDEHGIEIREIAGGYKMFTKAEHHEAVRRFVKSLTPPLRLSMAALETLATVAYRQPITVPEIQAIRGVQGAG